MIPEDLIEQVIDDQEKAGQEKKTVQRDKKINDTKRVIVITGIRRCGKSTFLKQINKSDNSIVINLEDNRLEGFTMVDFNKIEQIAKKKGKQIIILDEVQNITGWEKYVRAANERGVQLQITGSNASMLSRELGTHLTGRYSQIELFPFGYNEFLLFTGELRGLNSFQHFIEMGGFPEYLEENNPEYLQTLVRDIIMRDIAVRRGIKNEHYLLRLAVHILSNVGKEFSFNNITKTLEIKSVHTTIDYCDYLRESYLVDFIPRFSYSIHQQLANPKKAYCVDTAMASANSLSFSKDMGRMLENAVFIELRRSFSDISYYKNPKTECDFLIKDKDEITLAIQVCLKITTDNIQREVQGLKDAMAETKCHKGIIITLDQEDELDGVSLIPAWKWMR
jgi:uncharacterized protein